MKRYLLVLLLGMFLVGVAFGEDKLPLLAEGVKIMAGDKPLWAEDGFAMPFAYDFNKDGKKDLIVGQWGLKENVGKARIYLNVGTDAAPKFGGFRFMQAAGKDAVVPPSWCITFSPRVVDLNGDGFMDVVSGEYNPGNVYFFEGTKDGFKDKVVIKEENADPDDIERWQCDPSFVDWDGDGDLDMVVGSILGKVYLNINKGTKKEFKFGKRVQIMTDSGPLKASSGCHPVVVDWDGDGVLDILLGDRSGQVVFCKGKANRTFAKGVPIFEGKDVLVKGSMVARPAVVDWNNDGLLDLLVGSAESNKDDRSAPMDGFVYLFLRKK